jgi:hypothetical protein
MYGTSNSPADILTHVTCYSAETGPAPLNLFLRQLPRQPLLNLFFFYPSFQQTHKPRIRRFEFSFYGIFHYRTFRPETPPSSVRFLSQPTNASMTSWLLDGGQFPSFLFRDSHTYPWPWHTSPGSSCPHVCGWGYTGVLYISSCTSLPVS